MRLLPVFLLFGCPGGPSSTTTPTASTTTIPTNPSTQVWACTPSEAVFEPNIAPILEESCGSCHGATPDFGAPYSLVTYADLMEIASDDDRRVDKVLAALMEQEMPPGSAPQMRHFELDTLVGWSSCGEDHPPVSNDLAVSRTVWNEVSSPPVGSTPIELFVGEQDIGIGVLDEYRSFTFSSIVDEPRHIRFIEMIIDETRVLHHITLGTNGGLPYYYTWAPGTQPFGFPEGGLFIDANTVFTLEIHYNNGAGIPDATDNSGVRLWVDEPVGPEWKIMTPQTWNITVPPHGDYDAVQSCTATMDFTIHAAGPHMHEIGTSFSHHIVRVNGDVDELISLVGWSFESQLFYQTDMEVHVGDELVMTCSYHNPHDYTVVAGQGSRDEMCFDFLYVTPAEAALQCPRSF